MLHYLSLMINSLNVPRTTEVWRQSRKLCVAYAGTKLQENTTGWRLVTAVEDSSREA